MPTYLKDHFDLPDVVRGGDFVLRQAGVLNLLPCHNVLNSQGLGGFPRGFAEEEARRMGKTLEEVPVWRPVGGCLGVLGGRKELRQKHFDGD